MKLNNQIKSQISDALNADYEGKKNTFTSRNTYAKSIDIHPTTVSNVISGKWLKNQVLVSDKKWIEIANAINFKISEASNTVSNEWQTANTEVYRHITAVLGFCKKHSETAMFIDIAGAGKTYSTDQFQKRNDHVFIIRGSDATSKTRFIKELVRAVGLDVKGSYDDMMDNAIRRILSFTTQKPLLIFDEAGDFDDATFLVIKRLYNRLEEKCGMFMCGAGGLRKKMDSGIRLDKNGFDEVADRFGYHETKLSIIPEEKTAKETCLAEMKMLICFANGINNPDDLDAIVKRGGTNRRAKKEINKRKGTN